MKKIASLVMIMVLLTALLPMQILAAGTGKKNVSLVGKYDSADTAAIRAIDTDNRTLRLRNHSTGKTYTLSYDNTSFMYDSYGQVLSPRLLEVGQIVDVTFLKSSKKLTTLNVSKDAWVVKSTRDHDLVRNDGTAGIRGESYKIDSRALVIADGSPALLEDVLSTDNVCVRGIGNDIYSVIVTSGHGYVSLSSDTVQNQSLVGAWLEVGNEVIYKITPNMLLSAPEGSYKLQILGKGANYQSDIDITRNEETVIDTSNVTINKPKEGLVTFQITPDTADVFVDGNRVLKDVPQSIQYGYHNLKIMAEGYITQNKYLKVGTPKSVINIELEKDSASSASSSASLQAASSASTSDKDIDNSNEGRSKISSNSNASEGSTKKKVSENSSSQSSEDDDTPRTIKGSKIYIDEPNGAEVYFDGKYIGIIPTNLTKISGNHEVIIKKEGYLTKSYRIKVDKEKGDVSYKFPPLVKVVNDEPATDGSSSSASSSASDSSSESSSASSEASSAASSETSGGSSGESASDSASTEQSTDSGSDSGSESGSEEGSGSGSEQASDAASTAHGGD